MTDLEATRLCAEAMGEQWTTENGKVQLVTYFRGHLANYDDYDPLHDDAQMAALIKHFRLHIDQRPGKHVTAQDPHFLHLIERPDGQLNAAVVYCVAAMQRAKPTGSEGRG